MFDNIPLSEEQLGDIIATMTFTADIGRVRSSSDVDEMIRSRGLRFEKVLVGAGLLNKVYRYEVTGPLPKLQDLKASLERIM